MTTLRAYCHNLYTVVFFLGSIYSTLAVAIERYVSVCHPHYVGFSEAGKMAVTGVILFSIVFNINRFFEYKTCYATEVSLVCPEWGPAPGTPRRDPDVLGVGAGRG